MMKKIIKKLMDDLSNLTGILIFKKTWHELFFVGYDFDSDIIYWEKYDCCRSIFFYKREFAGVGISRSSVEDYFFYFYSFKRSSVAHNVIYKKPILFPIPINKSLFSKVNEIPKKVGDQSIILQIKNQLMKDN